MNAVSRLESDRVPPAWGDRHPPRSQGGTVRSENSKIYDYIKNIPGINIETYETTKDLFKLNKRDVYIVLDKYTFDYYSIICDEFF